MPENPCPMAASAWPCSRRDDGTCPRVYLRSCGLNWRNRPPEAMHSATNPAPEVGQ